MTHPWLRGPASDLREISEWLAPIGIVQWLTTVCRAAVDMARAFGPPDIPVLTEIIEDYA